jgi:hypothetical protein
MALEAYDRIIGLKLSDMAVDGCITKAPCGGEKAGKSPVDRGKGAIKRSTVVDEHDPEPEVYRGDGKPKVAPGRGKFTLSLSNRYAKLMHGGVTPRAGTTRR